MLDGREEEVAQIVVAPAESALGGQPTIFAATRSGVWRSDDEGLNWHPAVRGLGLLVTHDVAVDPADPNRVYTASSDFRVHASTDGLTTVTQHKPPLADEVAANTSTDGARAQALALVASGSGPSRVVVGVSSNTDNRRGEVDIYDPASAAAWRSLELSLNSGSTPSEAPRPLDIVTRGDGDQVEYLVSVWVNDSGLVPLANNGVWHGVTRNGKVEWHPLAAPMSRGWRVWSIAWPELNRDFFFVYELGSRIWRYSFQLSTWTNIVPLPPAATWAAGAGREAHHGFLATDRMGDVLFASVGPQVSSGPASTNTSLKPGLYRFTPGSSVAEAWNPTAILQGPSNDGTFRAGPLTAARGGDGEMQLYFAYSDHGRPELVRVRDAASSSPSIESLVSADDSTYSGAAHLPSAIAVSTTGELYISLAGNGVVRSQAECAQASIQ